MGVQTKVAPCIDDASWYHLEVVLKVCKCQAVEIPEPELSESLEGMMSAGKRHPGKRRAFTPSSQQLLTLKLNDGQNTIDFLYGKQRLRAYLYYLTWNVR